MQTDQSIGSPEVFGATEQRKAPEELNFEAWKIEMVKRVEQILASRERAVVSLAGASASGKGEATEQLTTSLEAAGKRVLSLSTDDFYKGIARMMTEKAVAGIAPDAAVDLDGLTDFVRETISPKSFGEKFSDEVLAEIKDFVTMHYPKADADEITAALRHEFAQIDFDNPDAVNLAGVNAAVKKLLESPDAEVALPGYSMKTGEADPDKTRLVKGSDYDVILVEGLYGLNETTTTGLPTEATVKSFVETDLRSLLMRRCRRDILRGRTSFPPETTLFFTLEIVLPAYKRHILPDRGKADLILKNSYTEAETLDTNDFDVQDKLLVPAAEIERLVAELGETQAITAQDDYYFTNETTGHEPNHLIRVRVQDGQLKDLVHKGTRATRADGKNIRPTETYIKSGEFGQHYSEIEQLLAAFQKGGFRLITKIAKERRMFEKDGVEIAMDHIDGLGDFAELRTNNRVTAAPEIDRFKGEHGLADAPSVGPYIDLFLEKIEAELKKKIETELKFRLDKLPDGLQDPTMVDQTYLAFDQDEQRKQLEIFFRDAIDWSKIKEARIRRKIGTAAAHYYLTLKSDGTADREEYEEEICGEDYHSLKRSLPDQGSIEKIRYTLPIPATELVVEVDQYLGKLEGLLIAEIEYDRAVYPDQAAVIGLAEPLIGVSATDVTADKRFKNRSLALQESLNIE